MQLNDASWLCTLKVAHRAGHIELCILNITYWMVHIENDAHWVMHIEWCSINGKHWVCHSLGLNVAANTISRMMQVLLKQFHDAHYKMQINHAKPIMQINHANQSCKTNHAHWKMHIGLCTLDAALCICKCWTQKAGVKMLHSYVLQSVLTKTAHKTLFLDWRSISPATVLHQSLPF